MTTLKEIKIFANNNNACYPQYKNFKKFYYLDLIFGRFTEKFKILAWQTVLGNLDWLIGKGLNLNKKYVEIQAKNIGKTWYYNGKIDKIFNYENGKLNGDYKYFDNKGKLIEKCNYLNGKLNGDYEQFYFKNGNLYIKTTYKNDLLHGFYYVWDINGELIDKKYFENDKQIKL